MSERNQKDLSSALKCFAQTVTNFLLASTQTMQKMSHDHNLEINMITRKIIPFFQLLFKLYPWKERDRERERETERERQTERETDRERPFFIYFTFFIKFETT